MLRFEAIMKLILVTTSFLVKRQAGQGWCKLLAYFEEGVLAFD